MYRPASIDSNYHKSCLGAYLFLAPMITQRHKDVLQHAPEFRKCCPPRRVPLELKLKESMWRTLPVTKLLLAKFSVNWDRYWFFDWHFFSLNKDSFYLKKTRSKEFLLKNMYPLTTHVKKTFMFHPANFSRKNTQYFRYYHLCTVPCRNSPKAPAKGEQLLKEETFSK